MDPFILDSLSFKRKRCLKCKFIKDFRFFNKNSRTKDKKERWCKDCIRKYYRIRYANVYKSSRDKVKYKERSKKYYCSIKSDPEKYNKWCANKREKWRKKKALIIRTLIKKNESKSKK